MSQKNSEKLLENKEDEMKSINSETEIANSKSESIKSKSERINSESESINSETESIKSGTVNNQKKHRGPRGFGGPGAMMPTEKPKNFKETMKKLFIYMGAYKIGLIAVVVFAIGGSAFSIVGPKILARAINKLFSGLLDKFQGVGSIDFDYIGNIILLLIGLYVLSAILSFIQGYIMTGVSQKVSYKMRSQISEKINKMPLNYFESRTVGEVLSRITNDVDTLGQSLNQSVTQLITSITLIIGVIIMMLSISPLMTLISFTILPVSMILIMVVVKFSQKYFNQQQKHLGDINGQVEEVFSGHNIVKAFNKENDVKNIFTETNNKLYKTAWKSQFLSGMMMPVMTFVSNLGYVGVVISGCMLAANGTISVGDIQAFIQYVRTFTHPIIQLSQVSSMLQSTAAAAERVFEFLEESEEVPETNMEIDLEKVEGHVEFKNVHFGYSEDKIIINDFSSNVEAGKMVAIVGPTGAGKTTMVKLLMRFYDVNSGSILVDGHDIKDIKRKDLRNLFGMVLQETWLFKGSIMENIRYGRLDATDEEVIAAAKSAHAHHFIKTLPDGYNMELNEDASNVSQGQRQLITIARAILADNKIMILDEATSSVDTRTEVRIQKAMANLMKGRTSFVIAHRLSTIREADLILVMKDGDIIEQGKHEELLEKEGFYAGLYNSQFETETASIA